MTYSIVAHDKQSGQIGVAVQTALIGVGALCPWVRAGVGAVATQSLVRVSHGPNGLQLMGSGHSAPEALAAVLAGDAGREMRQLAMVDSRGNVDAYTGGRCIRYAGHIIGDGYAVQANMMLHPGVPEAMAAAYENSSGPLVERLLAALHQAQQAGGDFRGQQSAALLIADETLRANRWEGMLFNVRVDDDPAPVDRLAQICSRIQAERRYAAVFRLAEQGEYEQALERFHQLHTAPSESGFYFVIEMAMRHQQVAQVADELRAYFQEKRWRDYFRRLAEVRYPSGKVREAVEALMPEDSTL